MKKQLFISLLAATLFASNVPAVTFASSDIVSEVNQESNAVDLENEQVSDEEAEEIAPPKALEPVPLNPELIKKRLEEGIPYTKLIDAYYENKLTLAKQNSEYYKQYKDYEFDNSTDQNDVLTYKYLKNIEKELAPIFKEVLMNSYFNSVYDLYFNYQILEAQIQQYEEYLPNIEAWYSIIADAEKNGKILKSEAVDIQKNLQNIITTYNNLFNSKEICRLTLTQYLSYETEQEFILTDTLTPVTLPEYPSDETIKEAYEKNYYLKTLQKDLTVNEYAFNKVKAYPKSSINYRTAYYALNIAQLNLEEALNKLDKNIMTKYSTIQIEHLLLTDAQQRIEFAENYQKAIQLEYENGTADISDVFHADLDMLESSISYFSMIYLYNSSVLDYELSLGAGLETQ